LSLGLGLFFQVKARGAMAPVWDINPILFYVPGTELAVRYYGLIFALVFLGGFVLFYRQTIKAGGTVDDAYDLIIPGFLGLLLGARLGHVFFYNFDRFLNEPTWVFRVWEGGLASHGAAIGLSLALSYYAKRHRLPILAVTDRFSFSAALGAGMIRLGNFFNSEIVGRITDGPFGVKFPLYDQLPPAICPARYPSQLVEFVLGFFILGTLAITDRLLGGPKRPRGVLSALFLVLYFLGRFLVEFIKERQGPNDQLFFSRGQLLTLPHLALGLVLLWHCLKRPRYDLAKKSPNKKASGKKSSAPSSSLSAGKKSSAPSSTSATSAAQGPAPDPNLAKMRDLKAYAQQSQRKTGSKKPKRPKGRGKK
jgi:phosphatidylglycerol:prolipoprotein diacylglycerol transferase